MNWFHWILNQRELFVYELFTYKARKHSFSLPAPLPHVHWLFLNPVESTVMRAGGTRTLKGERKLSRYKHKTRVNEDSFVRHHPQFSNLSATFRNHSQLKY